MIIAFINQKGGVGKTMLSVNTAARLAQMGKGEGKRVLLVDADEQGSSLNWADRREADPLFNVVGFPRKGIDRQIGPLSADYGHVVIDGPARLWDVSRSVVRAADAVVIPVQPGEYDVWAAEETVDLIEQVEREGLKKCFLVNRCITKTNVSRVVFEVLEQYQVPTLRSRVTQRVVFTETSSGHAVYEIDSKPFLATNEINSVVDEILAL